MRPKVLLNSKQLALTIDRLCYQLIENHKDFDKTAIVGVQPRGVYFAEHVFQRINQINSNSKARYGKLDVSMYRDDFRRTDKTIISHETLIDFNVEKKRIVLVDDVLYTGRTIRSALDALNHYGRPAKVELMVLIDRRFSKELPISADYIGRRVDAIESQRVKVEWEAVHGESRILMVKDKNTDPATDFEKTSNAETNTEK